MSDSASFLFQRLVDNSPGRRAIQIVAFGDSVTQGCMELGRQSPQETYHRLLQHDLEAFYPDQVFNVTNSGVAGETASQGLLRLERDVLLYRPDLLLIAFGLNDATLGREALCDFEAAVREMLRRVREAGETTVVLVTPPFMATERSFRIHASHLEAAAVIIRTQTEGALAEFSEVLRTLARQEGVLLADVYAEWERLAGRGTDMNSWLSNGLNHPDGRGHRLAARVIWNALFSGQRGPGALIG